MTSACQCRLDELEQTMSFEQFLHDGLRAATGKEPSQAFMDAAEGCAPSAAGGGSPNLS